jgi:enoyl-[acyl-carrier protein] reductase/trans-2-enoyl-CoA reductase (NAD+)
MNLRRIAPNRRGYLFVNAHPAGCAGVVDRLWEAAGPAQRVPNRRPVALVIGSSGGYGLAAMMVGMRRYGIRGVAVSLESPANGRRTASAGWYRTCRTAELAASNANDITFLNADAFTSQAKDAAVHALAERYGRADYLIYSLAAPQRVHPETGEIHRSVIKTIGPSYPVKTMSLTDEGPVVATVTVPTASQAEVTATVAVMGGADWELWVDALQQHDLVAPGFTTVALSYVGSQLLSPIYRGGTLGAAKEDLETTAVRLRETTPAQRAYAVVAGAAVTQASMAIPGSALYLSILKAITVAGQRSMVTQAAEMWKQITGETATRLDQQGRIRLDQWELDSEVQAEALRRWNLVETSNLADLADAGQFQGDHHQLYGWGVPGVDYSAPVPTVIKWPGRLVS